MEIQAITPNYYSNPYNKTAYDKRANVAFQARYVETIEKMMEGSTKESFVEKLKTKLAGNFGFSKSKVTEFLERVYDDFTQLIKDNKALKDTNARLSEQISAFPEKLRQERNAATKDTTNSLENQIEKIKQYAEAKVSEAQAKIAAAEEEAAKAREEAAKAREEADKAIKEADKYAPVYKIKPAMEGLITPEQGIKLFEEIVEKEPIAQENLINFMLRGEGKEEVLAQLERYRDLENISEAKSPNYLLRNSSVDRALTASGIWQIPNMNLKPTIFDLLQRAIEGSKDVQDILSTPGFRKQAAQNLAAIAKPNNAISEKNLERWSHRSQRNVTLSVEKFLELKIEEFVTGSNDCWSRI